MTPYEFDYARAASVDEALAMLSSDGAGEVRLLAGGHSLIPAMKLRLSAPAKLVDISALDELKAIETSGGRLRIGALATHDAVARADAVRSACPVLAEAAACIGDPQVRNRGTIGGSLAHADPAADYPALLLALEADVEIAGPSGTRTVSGEAFFTGMYETAVAGDELITAVRFPVLEAGTGAAYAKFANPASRYAVVGVAAVVALDVDGACAGVRVAVTGAAPVAFRATGVERALTGATPDEDAVRRAVAGMADPADLLDDLSAGAAYRAHLCEVMTRRALLQAAERARA